MPLCLPITSLLPCDNRLLSPFYYGTGNVKKRKRRVKSARNFTGSVRKHIHSWRRAEEIQTHPAAIALVDRFSLAMTVCYTGFCCGTGNRKRKRRYRVKFVQYFTGSVRKHIHCWNQAIILESADTPGWRNAVSVFCQQPSQKCGQYCGKPHNEETPAHPTGAGKYLRLFASNAHKSAATVGENPIKRNTGAVIHLRILGGQ